jgi:hypothetical protein
VSAIQVFPYLIARIITSILKQIFLKVKASSLLYSILSSYWTIMHTNVMAILLRNTFARSENCGKGYFKARKERCLVSEEIGSVGEIVISTHTTYSPLAVRLLFGPGRLMEMYGVQHCVSQSGYKSELDLDPVTSPSAVKFPHKQELEGEASIRHTFFAFQGDGKRHQTFAVAHCLCGPLAVLRGAVNPL